MAVLPSEIAAEGGEKNIAAEHTDTAAGEKKHAERAARQGELSARKVSKGFKFVCANLLFVGAESRFAEPRSFLKKVLIVAVRSCHCGALIRGLQNLGASLKRF